MFILRKTVLVVIMSYFLIKSIAAILKFSSTKDSEHDWWFSYIITMIMITPVARDPKLSVTHGLSIWPSLDTGRWLSPGV